MYNDIVDRWYIDNLTNGRSLAKKATSNLFEYMRYEVDRIPQLNGYDKIGLVEYVAADEFMVIGNDIVPLETSRVLDILVNNEG